jgi:uncharacterized damage-inducible protein DinB
MLIEMFKYQQWADRRTLDAVVGMDGGGHPSSIAFARQQLNHMIRFEELFRARLLGEPAPTLPPIPHCFRTSMSSTAR